MRVAGLKDQVDAGLRTRSADGLRPSDTLRAIGARVSELVDRQSQIFVDEIAPDLAGGRHPTVGLVVARRRRPRLPGRRLSTTDLPRPDAAGRRPRPSVPLHLEPVAQPDRPRRGSRHRRGARRPGQGPAPAAPVRGHARRRALRRAGADHRRPSGHSVPGHGHRRALRLPGHPQRRPRPRGGRGRRPARRRRDGAAPSPLRPGRAPRGRRRHLRRHARHAGPRARPRSRGRLRDRRPARPRWPVGGARARPARAPRSRRGRR